MTDYTPAQLALIEEHRDWNVEHDWWDSTYEDFCNVALSFGIHVKCDDIAFSGFWSQGDGASFTFGNVNAYDVIVAAIKVEQSGEYGPGGYVDEFTALGKLLLDSFNPFVLTCPEGREIAEAYSFRAERTGHHYSHSNTVTVSAEFDHNAFDPNGSEPQRAVWSALADKLFGIDTKHRPDCEPSLEKQLDEAVKAIADALYKSLNDEYDYLTSDEAVWESLEANGVEPEADEEDEEDLELAEAA